MPDGVQQMIETIVAFVLLTVSPDGAVTKHYRAQIPAGECLADQAGLTMERIAGSKHMLGQEEIITVLCEPCPCKEEKPTS